MTDPEIPEGTKEMRCPECGAWQKYRDAERPKCLRCGERTPMIAKGGTSRWSTRIVPIEADRTRFHPATEH